MSQSQPVATTVSRTRAIEDLYVRHITAARSTAYLMTGDRAAAEDLAQEAFLRVIGRFQHLRDPEAFPAYLRRAVVNMTLNHLRKRKAERAYLERERGEPVRAASFPDVGEQERLWQALLMLPPRRRAAVVLRYYEDLSEQQAAEALRCSVGAVRSLVAHAMKTLRQQLGEPDGD